MLLNLVILAASAGPCDILGGAGKTCVAAHSTTRALYAAYGGPPSGEVKNGWRKQ